MEESDEITRDGSQNTHRPSGFSLSSTRPPSSQNPPHSQVRYHLSSSNPQTVMTSLDPHWNNINNISLNNSMHHNQQKISLPPLTSLEPLHTRPTFLSNDNSTPPKRPRTDSVQLPPIPLPQRKEPSTHPTFPPNQFSLPSIHFSLVPSTVPTSNPLASRSLDPLQLEPREQVSLPAVSTLLSLSSTSAPTTPPATTPPPIVAPQPSYPPTYPRHPIIATRSPQPQTFSFAPSSSPFQFGMLSPSPHPSSSVLHSPQHQTSFQPSPSPQVVAPFSSASNLNHIQQSLDTMRIPVAQPVVTSPATTPSIQRPKPGSDTAWVNSTFFQIRWEQNYALLKQFYQLYGHSNVTRAEGQWKPLGNWVAEQRRKLKKGKLTPDQVKKLNELGFEWDRSYYFQQGRDSSEDEPRSPTGAEDRPASIPSSSTASTATQTNTDNDSNNNNNVTPISQPRNNDETPAQTAPTQPNTGGS